MKKNIDKEICSIILAGGKGTRMFSREKNKVCFLVGGKPAINRAIEIYNGCGAVLNVVVVGDSAEDVIQTVGKKFSNVVFTYQQQQLGTGNAARCAAEVLKKFDYSGDILVAAGDKVIQPDVIRKIIEKFNSSGADCVIAVGMRRDYPSAGRVIKGRGGDVARIVEVRDIKTKRILAALRKKAVSREKIDCVWAKKYILSRIPSEKKVAVALGEVWDLINKGRTLKSAQLIKLIPKEATGFAVDSDAARPITVTAEAAEKSEYCNLSIYMFSAEALYYALDRITTDNAQKEEYLTDVIEILASDTKTDATRFKIEILPLKDSRQVMAFNNPEELLQIQSYLRELSGAGAVKKPRGLKPVAEWLAVYRKLEGTISTAKKSLLYRKLAKQYTDNENVIAERAGCIISVLDKFHKLYGPDTEAIVVRAPGRVNVMGKHIDRIGGISNQMAINREIVMAVSPRDDYLVNLASDQPGRFEPCSFSISEMVAELDWDDWLMNVKSERIKAILDRQENDWANYIQAAILRLQQKFQDVKIKGMDIVIKGNIPIGAGLSSSSAVVMAAAEAVIHLNQLDIDPQQYVDLCSEGEWFFGPEEFNVDNAALKFSQQGSVARIKHRDFQVEEFYQFPPDWALVICDSHVKTTDFSGWRDVRSRRMATYAVGKTLVKQFFPQYSPLIKSLVDISAEKLIVPLSKIYDILLQLPRKVSRKQLTRMLSPEELADIQPFLQNHSESAEDYPVRGMALFALAENARAQMGIELVKAKDIAGFGSLMNASHDGDRVTAFDESGRKKPFLQNTGDKYLRGLIEDLESGVSERIERAQLWRQTGWYRCSTKEIDRMIDIARATEGVYGAQISGAGLGGCIMVLTTKEHITRLRGNLHQHYYRPQKLPAAVFPAIPVAGSCVLEI